MLFSLRISNFALIDQLYIEFGAGLNILTGETGAGKSIIIDAVNVIIGSRATTEVIRTGCDHAMVEAVFYTESDSLATQELALLGIELEDDGLIIITRKIMISGKSVASINGRTATLTMIKRMAESLLDIHGQHDHQSLFRAEKHIDMLDIYGSKELSEQRNKVRQNYQKYCSVSDQLDDIVGNEQERARRYEMLDYQCEEIAAAVLIDGEEEMLAAEQEILTHAERLASCSGKAYSVLYDGNEGEKAVIDQLGVVLKELREIVKIDNRMTSVLESTENAYYQLEDAAREVEHYRNGIEYNPLRLREIHERMDLLTRLKRKYGNTIAEILQYYHQAANERDSILFSDQQKQQLEQQLEELEQQLLKQSRALSEMRNQAGDKLANVMRVHLADLAMKNADFSVSIEQKQQWSPTGVDQVEFMFSSNQGEPPKPLSKVASGGEMSRIALALKTVIASMDDIPTLIFDEVDAGVGGRTALAVAEKMAAISEKRQVLCITHLPQIACMADQHFYIRKEVENGRTKTNVVKLEENGRVEEIMRMLGGEERSSAAREHAKELLANKKRKK